MTNQQILTKAFQKARSNGWKGILEGQTYAVHFDSLGNLLGMKHPNQVIFNHDFAKALWGEDERKPESVANSQFMTTVFKRDWRYHLQQMVIADDPIKYLGEHLDT